jgi:hypothetical protein
MLAKTSYSIRSPDVDRPTSQSGSAAAVTPDSGWTSVSVTNFARPISVSSSRCSTIAAPAGGAVSLTLSPTRKW